MAHINKNSENYQIRLNNTKIFAKAFFSGRIKIYHEIHNNKSIAFYISKNENEETVEETVSFTAGKQRAKGA